MRGPPASQIAALVVKGRSGFNEVGASGTLEGINWELCDLFGGDWLGILHYVSMYGILPSHLGLVDVAVCSPVRCTLLGG